MLIFSLDVSFMQVHLLRYRRIALSLEQIERLTSLPKYIIALPSGLLFIDAVPMAWHLPVGGHRKLELVLKNLGL